MFYKNRIKKCPHCNSDDGAYRILKPIGACREYIYNVPDSYTQNEHIEVVVDTEDMTFNNQKTYYCVSCNKIRKDIKKTMEKIYDCK